MNGVITQLWKRKETWHIVTLINPESMLNEISQTEKGKSSGYTRTRCQSRHIQRHKGEEWLQQPGKMGWELVSGEHSLF